MVANAGPSHPIWGEVRTGVKNEVKGKRGDWARIAIRECGGEFKNALRDVRREAPRRAEGDAVKHEVQWVEVVDADQGEIAENKKTEAVVWEV